MGSVTSLFSRLQKLNKEATRLPWKSYASREKVTIESRPLVVCDMLGEPTAPRLAEDAELIVECRNSLPAVLNLIEAARNYFEELTACGMAETAELEAAVAVFVSGQEEPK